MKTARIIIVLLTAICLPFAADSTEDRTIKRNKPTERRTALVIGNSAYRDSPLKNPVNDARDMAKVLEELGFTVIHKENAGLRDMEMAVSDFEKQLRQGGAGLFYYAGHGIQVKGNNYLIPTDAEIETESDAKYKAMDAGQVLGKMEDAGNGLNIVILDACRNNPFGRSFRSAQQGLAQMDAPAGSVVIFATGPNSVAADGTGRNGTFTKHLLTHIRKPGLKIEEVVKSVRRGVAQDTGNKQIPWEHSSLMGDFYFADSGSITTEKPQVPVEPEKPKQATLNITADVSGAEVSVNGNKQGVLPKNFTISESGKYEVEVTAPGYKKYRTSKNIELGKEYEVAVHLEKEQQDAPAPIRPPASVSSGDEDKGQWREPATGMEFVYVKGGCYKMGSPDSEKDRDSNEGPVHEVCVDDFWMGKNEVTNAEFRKFRSGHDSKDYEGNSLNGDRQPAVYVNWEEAVAFAKWLSEKSGHEIRLPSEAEWEYACRAGTKAARFWGDDADKACIYGNVADQTAKQKWSSFTVHNCDDGHAVTAPVGSYKANAFGLNDMLGNVWEWCLDIYDSSSYSKHGKKNPIYAGAGSDIYADKSALRVLRGGSWVSVPARVRCAYRDDYSPADRAGNIGFRLLRKP